MKNLMLSIGLGMLLMNCNAKPDKDDVEMKAKAISSCENAALQPTMSDSKKTLVKEYCSCATDKMLGEFTYAEMLQMNNPSQELQDRLMKLVDPCLKELKVKSAELGE